MTSEEICLEYQQAQNTAAKEKLLMRYLPLVKYIAERMAIWLPRSLEVDDLINAGMIGLIEAVNNFDPSRGVKLETFVRARIQGAIIDELRKMSTMSRSVRKHSKRVKKVFSHLSHQLGRQPTHKELAQSLGVSPEELSKCLVQSEVTSPPISLDSVYYTDKGRQVSLIEAINSDQEDALSQLEREDLKEYLVEQIAKLPEQQRMVLVLHYYEELTLKEISEILHLSESRISQIHTAAILVLRRKVKKWLEGE